MKRSICLFVLGLATALAGALAGAAQSATPQYLPKSGGTLTGALTGTSATFSGSVQAPTLHLNAAWFGLSTAATGTANSTALNACLSYIPVGQTVPGQICEMSPGNYHIAQTIKIEQGTSLMGMSTNHPAGTLLTWDGTGGCILSSDTANAGPMYGSEVALFTVVGSATGDTAICLYPGPVGSPGPTIQFANIHDLRIDQATNGIEIQSCSYCTIQRINAFGPGAGIGLNFSKTTVNQLIELNKILDNSFQNYAVGLQVESPQSALNWFDHDDFSQETQIGMSFKWINGGNWYFDGIDNSGDPLGIQFNPTGTETVYGGMYFTHYGAFMPGVSAAEVAIGIAAGSNNNVSRLYFRDSGIGKTGATAPTNSISLANAVNLENGDIQFTNLTDASGGGHLLPTPTMLQTPFLGVNLWTGNAADPDLNSTFDANNFMLTANERVSGTNYHIQTVKYTGNGCFGYPGIAYFGDAANGSGVARNTGTVSLAGCITNPNPWSGAGTQLYGSAYFGQYIAKVPHYQPGFDCVPDSTDDNTFPCYAVENSAGVRTGTWSRGGDILAKSVQLSSTTGISCSSSTGGETNYIAGATSVKDTVQVCAKDASNAWAWRPLYGNVQSFSAFIPTTNGLAVNSNIALFYADVPINITRVTFDSGTASLTCTTTPVVSVYDATAAAIVTGASVTLTGGSASSTPTYTAVTSGHALYVRLTTAAATCTTYAQNVNITVQYTTQ